MAASSAIDGYQTTFAIGDGETPEVFTALAEVMSITPPSDALDIYEVTHLSSPDRTKEFRAGFSDPGECQVVINFIPGGADDTVLQAIRNTGEVGNYRITYNNSDTWTFAAIMTGYQPGEITHDDRLSATLTFKLTGTYAVA